MKKISFLSVLAVATLVTSCWYNHKWEDLHPVANSTPSLANCDTASVMSYSANIKPIIQANCTNAAGCHNGTNSPGAGASNYNIFNVVRSDCNSGTFMQRVSLPLSNPQHMPQGGGFLSTCDTFQIRKWIKSGCPNN